MLPSKRKKVYKHKEHKVKYLKDEPFLGVGDKPFRVSWDGGEAREATVAEMVRLYLGPYQPQQGKMLDMSGLRALNRCLNILEGEPDEGYHAFEEADWRVLVQVFGWMAPLVHPRQSPYVEDALNAAKNKKEPLLGVNGKVEDRVLQEVQ